MGMRFTGYVRRSFKYVEGWKGEDCHEACGEFMILKSRFREVSERESRYGEVGTRIYTVRVPRGLSKLDIVNALCNAFTRGCRCEHDCCGHVQTCASMPKRMRRRTWVVEARLFYNV